MADPARPQKRGTAPPPHRKKKTGAKKPTCAGGSVRARPLPNAPLAQRSFPVVGIGASAGWLDAFKRFFNAMSPESGMASVLIQHLDPTHESLMVDLLTRYTAMKVVQVEDRMPVEMDHVYMIPPNKYLAINNGVLDLTGPIMRRGMRMPIDFFFRSLAEDQQEKVICIILSGTGTDVTLGVKAIKTHGGMVVAQEPTTAQYDGMPQSSIATGVVDDVLPGADRFKTLVEATRATPFKSGEGSIGSVIANRRPDWVIDVTKHK